MDDSTRLHLQKLLAANDGAVDQTPLIRQLKHSHILRDNIQTLVDLKTECGDNDTEIRNRGMNECGFMHQYYTDIFNKIVADEIDIGLLFNFLDVLQKIEDNKIDQHDGSFEVGTILKKIYIDSALKKSDKLDKREQEDKVGELESDSKDMNIRKMNDKNMSYSEFKRSCTENATNNSDWAYTIPPQIKNHGSKKKKTTTKPNKRR